MKTKIIKTIAALMLSLLSLPMMGQDFMEVYFKDGIYKKFYLEGLKEWKVSQYDADGVKHADYNYQHIKTNTHDFVFDLEKIDSIVFKKFDEEKAKQDFCETMSIVITALYGRETIEDVEPIIEQIKKAEGVEKVWYENYSLYVRIKNWETISFHFNDFIGEDNEGNNAALNLVEQVKSHMPQLMQLENTDGHKPSIVVVNQNHYDTNRSDYIDLFQSLLDDFDKCGFDTEYVDYPTIDFFDGPIYQYDYVLLCTHGGYTNGQHTFVTGEVLGKAFAIKDKISDEDWNDFGDAFNDMMALEEYKKYQGIATISYAYETEWRNYLPYFVGHPEIREDFFGEGGTSQGFFASNSIFFDAACHNAEGDSDLSRFSFADKLIKQHGLRLFLGYSKVTNKSHFASCDFFRSLLYGESTDLSYEKLDPNYIDEFWDGAHLYYRYSDNNNSFFFITPTITSETDPETVKTDYYNSKIVSVKGYTTSLDPQKIKCGFLYSTDKNLSSAKNVIDNAPVKGSQPFADGRGNVVFRYDIKDLQPGNTYYYCAYTYDDMYYNCGDTLSFNVPFELQLSTQELSLTAGSTTTVEITSGNGDYSVSVDKPTIATATLSGTTISIKGEAKGTAKLTVKDKSGQTAEISVNVKEFISPYCPDNNHPHLIDLGLPSGTLWACCNVEATSPELSGGYYAWGETNTKDVYSWNTYSLCNGTKTSCRHIGEDIACTEYDVAHVKWGGQWVMPSREQIRELLDNCTQKKITLNGVNGTLVNGMNGSSIFLPFSGYRSGGSLQDEGTNSKYWSSSLDPNNEYYAYHFFFQSGGGYSSNSGYNYRYYGFTVRPIVSKELKLSQNSVEMFAGKSATVEIINGSGSFEISNSNANVVQAVLEGAKITLTAKTEGNAVVTVKDKSAGLTGSVSVTVKTIPNLVLSQNNVDLTIGAQATIEIISGSGEYGVTHLDDASSIAKATLNGSKININALIAGVAKIVVVDMQSGQKVVITITVETNAVAVNLGLPSGTLWADRNVGASTPEDAGEYYAWGETEYKPNNCTVNTYSLCTNGDASTCVSLGDIAGTQYDVAYVKWGTLWTIPTIEQAQELLDYCTFEWNTVNTVKGFTVTGLNGNSIFIPAAGCHHGGVTQNGGVGIDLWLSEQNDRRIDWAAEITSNYYGDTPYIDQRMDRYFGLFVRPVKTSHTNPLSLELKSINLMLDESISFEVTSGNGDYGISYIDNANTIIDATINGTIVTVNALNAGNAKFAVTDITGRMALVTVVVIEDPVEPLSHEHESLMQLFKDTNGNFWIHNDNWRSDKSLDKWYGISLNSSGKVTNIRLSNNNLSGNVSIREFTSLYNIELVGNNLSSIVIDSCPELDLGYGFRGLNGITADYVNINNCLSGQGQHFLNDANIKIIEFSNLINCGRIFLRGVTAEKVIIRNSEFPSQAIYITEGNNVDTLLVEDSNVWSNLGPDANHLIIKNSIVNKWWQIGAKMSITLENATIEGQTFTITGTPEEVNNYLRQFIN